MAGLSFFPADIFSPLVPKRVFGPRTCWTIDRTHGAGDNGFLDCARQHTPGAGADSSTAEAITNLFNCVTHPLTADEMAAIASAGIANIVGHGNDGIIVTGQGQNPSDTTKYIAWFNRTTWGRELSKLKGHVSILKLWACHPGTGQEGADLVYEVMQETNAVCMGPTGFLMCGGSGFSMEKGSTWQVASPGQPKPAPIPAPTPHLTYEYKQIALELVKGSGKMINVDAVDAVEVSTRGKGLVLSLKGREAKEFLRLIDFATPVEIDGALAAIPTGMLVLTVLDDKQQPHKKEFLIYNNRMLQSVDDKKLHFRCSEFFSRALITGLV